ncbi:hypothetical protein AOCH_005693 [Aspergillus ochraceoroseus]|uniref:Transcription factor Rba50 n=1 Tax=Aspergillus ochraceoroseus TaxID=138278 RepID=A0A0F8X132_9EURO|nr:hypothetical protein AOCH_005693 [Aspergillus ochraceoroseus]
MAFRGERFVVDLDSDPEDQSRIPSSTLNIPGVIGEIQERSPAAPPAPPTLKSTTGFPAHRQRTKLSAFKQRQAKSTSAATASTQVTTSSVEDEKKQIQEQNRQQLGSMSDAQIQQEREELISSLDPSLLERFLRRARIDDDNPDPSSSSEIQPGEGNATSDAADPLPPPEPVTKPAAKPVAKSISKSKDSSHLDDAAPSKIPEDLLPAAEFPLSGSVHFPTPPPRATVMPTLDPSSPSFLSDLQAHYFPDISHDPSALSWLQPPPSDPDAPGAPPSSAYHPGSSAEAVHPSSLRFSLIGAILSPSTSLSLPTTMGLHHHGKDPHAAGYTIPELAILSRSSFPAQRCIAWQVLGRILFRLGKGQFGERGSTLVQGLWSVIEREGVVAGMLEEADASMSSSSSSRRGDQDSTAAEPSEQDSTMMKKGGVGRHASAAAWAVEGVWLWQMGGGGDRGS